VQKHEKDRFLITNDGTEVLDPKDICPYWQKDEHKFGLQKRSGHYGNKKDWNRHLLYQVWGATPESVWETVRWYRKTYDAMLEEKQADKDALLKKIGEKANEKVAISDECAGDLMELHAQLKKLNEDIADIEEHIDISSYIYEKYDEAVCKKAELCMEFNQAMADHPDDPKTAELVEEINKLRNVEDKACVENILTRLDCYMNFDILMYDEDKPTETDYEPIATRWTNKYLPAVSAENMNKLAEDAIAGLNAGLEEVAKMVREMSAKNEEGKKDGNE
jgi:uncharacterized membrane protein YheB (UPF0754 family)